MMEKKTGLGKGLSVLFGEKKVDMSSVSGEIKEKSSKNFIELEIQHINLNPYQPREDFNDNSLKELAASIKLKGLIQPITVKPSVTPGMFDLISGERRLRASRLLGKKIIPAYILTKADPGPENMLELAIIENIQREDLNSMELSVAFQRLIDECDLTQEEIASKVSKQRSTVANILRLQKLASEIQVSLRKNEISEAHARLILRAEKHDEQIAIWKKILTEGLSVKAAENLTKKHAKQKKKKVVYTLGNDNFLKSLEEKLMFFFGTKVIVKPKSKKSGEIIIEYYTDDDIERILDKIET